MFKFKQTFIFPRQLSYGDWLARNPIELYRAYVYLDT